MCEPSIVTDDWVTKGFHIHIDDVELRVFPIGDDRVGFAPFFGSTPQDKADAVIKIASNKCLADPIVRKSWARAARRARVHMLGIRGKLQETAKGRMAEFTFLEVAIERWKP